MARSNEYAIENVGFPLRPSEYKVDLEDEGRNTRFADYVQENYEPDLLQKIKESLTIRTVLRGQKESKPVYFHNYDREQLEELEDEFKHLERIEKELLED